VVEYRPSGNDHTDLNDALRRINILCNEPQYRDYEKIVVALLSDGKNQPRNNTVEPIVEELTNAKIQLLLVGWDQPVTCFKNTKPEILSSKNGIFEIINNLN
jgi:Mg-chelatase subunit ChlD